MKRKYSDGGMLSGVVDRVRGVFHTNPKQPPPQKGISGDVRYTGNRKPADMDVINPNPKPFNPTGQGAGLGRNRTANIDDAINAQGGDGMKRGGKPPMGGGPSRPRPERPHPSGGGLGSLAAAMGGAGGGGGAVPPPMPPGAGGPPMGGPPPGMAPGMKKGGAVGYKHGGHAFGQPKEDLHKKQANRPTKVFPAKGPTVKEEKAISKGEMKYKHGGHVIGGHHGHGKKVHGGHEHDKDHLHTAHMDKHKHMAGGMISKSHHEEGSVGHGKGDGGNRSIRKSTSMDGKFEFAAGGHVGSCDDHEFVHDNHDGQIGKFKNNSGSMPRSGKEREMRKAPSEDGKFAFKKGGHVRDGNAHHGKGYHGPHGITERGKTRGRII